MKSMLYFAAFLAVAVGVAHSYLGERYILMRLFRRSELPKLFGGTEFTTQTLRFAWHITTIAWLGFGVLLALLANPPLSSDTVSLVIGITFLATSLATFAWSRGRHLAWPIFLIIGAIAVHAAHT